MKEFYIDSDGIKLHAKLEMPEGNPSRCPLCIVQHGIIDDMEQKQIIAVAEAMREEGVATLRCELYGHGKSGGSFEKHTILKWLNNMLDVVDYAKGLDFVTDLYICGHSQGGLVTMLVAALRPDDLAAIILMCPAIVIIDSAREGKFFNFWSFDPAHIPDVVRAEGADEWLKTLMPEGFDPAAVQAPVFSGDYFRIAQHIHVDEAIEGWHGPVLLVHGTADEAVPVHYSREAAAAYENARLVILEDDDHCFNLHLDRLCEAVRTFLRDQA